MRILHINDCAGVARILAEAQRAMGHEVLLHLPPRAAGTRGIARYRRLGERMWDVLRMARRIRAEKFDEVHVHYGVFGIYGWWSRRPYVLHLHGSDIRGHPLEGKKARMLCTASAFFARRAALVFYYNPDTAERVRRVRSDGIYLPIPVDTNLFRPTVGRRSTDPVRILLISGLYRLKEIGTALAAVSRLIEEGWPVEVCSFNFGEDAERYCRVGGIQYTNRVRHEEMPEFINGFDIIVGQLGLGILSTAELEAMACRKPVVAHVADPDVYDRPPILQARTAEEVYRQIIRLVDNPGEREELGTTAREWVVARHTTALVVKRFLDACAAICH